MQWSRLDSSFWCDPNIQRLSFEDQRHYVAICSLRALLEDRFFDVTVTQMSQYLNVTAGTLNVTLKKLISAGLICDRFEPMSHKNNSNYLSNAAERKRKSRAKKKAEAALQQQKEESPEQWSEKIVPIVL